LEALGLHMARFLVIIDRSNALNWEAIRTCGVIFGVDGRRPGGMTERGGAKKHTRVKIERSPPLIRRMTPGGRVSQLS
jgi:hypothetical protein